MAIYYEPIEEPGKVHAYSNKFSGAMSGSWLDAKTRKPCGSVAFRPIEVKEAPSAISTIGKVGAGVLGAIVVFKAGKWGVNKIKTYFESKKQKEKIKDCIVFKKPEDNQSDNHDENII